MLQAAQNNHDEDDMEEDDRELVLDNEQAPPRIGAPTAAPMAPPAPTVLGAHGCHDEAREMTS